LHWRSNEFFLLARNNHENYEPCVINQTYKVQVAVKFIAGLRKNDVALKMQY
jgi:hypothetical protein